MAKDISIRKRQQIAKASRVMFLWVAGASVIAGASAVLLFVLTQKLIFNEKVLAEKSNTVQTLKNNNAIVDDLKKNIRVLNTDESLIRLKSNADSEPIQVIFDALPSSPNSVALGSSLQSPLLLGREGLKVESLSVTPIAGVEDSGETNEIASDTATDITSPSIQFSFSVSVPQGEASKLKELLTQFERSIRSVNITSTRVENQGEKLLLTVSGLAYYEPAKKVEITEKAVKP